MIVDDGGTIVLGGLIDEDVQESESKVPLLGDIPILGIPFRNVNKSNDTRELIIFITPHIISPDVSSPEVDLLHQTEADQAEE